MKIVADKNGIKVLDIPAKVKVPCPLFDVVMDLAVSSKCVKFDDNIAIMPYAKEQEQK